MPEHRFQLRAAFDYAGNDNRIEAVAAEIHSDEGWRDFELGLASPGFLIFVYAFLICQHTYFHANCTESELLLDHSDVELLLITGDDWKIERIHVGIQADLSGGKVTADTIAYIDSRMRQCPVSINLQEPEDYRIELKIG